MPSDSIAELPVNAAATNLVMAIATLPRIAAMIAILDSDDLFFRVRFLSIRSVFFHESAIVLLDRLGECLGPAETSNLSS